jgi:hypothetical protein
MEQQSISRRTLELAIHLISWLVILGFPLVMEDRSNSGIDLARYLRHCVVPLSYVLVFYLNYSLLVPRYLFHNRMRSFIIGNILIILAAALVLHLFQSVITPPHHLDPMESMEPMKPMGGPRPPAPHWLFYTRDVVLMIFVAGLGTAIRTALRWHQTEEQLIETEKQRAEAELKNLKNQLNPHFLLNTLNNIYALIAFNSDKAQEAVQELSRLLRYVLYENQENFVPLEKEMEFIRNYVSLMRIRLSSQVNVTVSLQPDPGKELVITPLLFISLIENAFKHGISPTEPSFISIAIAGDADGKVHCEIMNSNYPKAPTDKSGSGIGLRQVQRRLDLTYPGRYEWHHSVNEDGTRYTSILTIQTRNVSSQKS